MSGRDRLDNDAPTIHSVAEVRQPTQHELDDSHVDPVDAREVFDIIRAIGDPEHPLTLEQLRVVEERLITVDNTAMVPFTSPAAAGADEEEGVGGGGDPRKLPAGALCRRVHVQFTPTIPHCSMATLIGLSIRLKLERSLPADTKIRVSIAPGTHVSELAVNRQLADKERVAAATENSRLLEVVHQCIAPSVLQC